MTNPAKHELGDARRRVVLLALPPVQSLDVSGPHDVFATADAVLAARSAAARVGAGMVVSAATGYEVCLVAGGRGAAAVAVAGGGFALLPRTDYRRWRGNIDTLLVVGGEGAEHAGAADAGLLAWLRRRAAATRRVGSVCTGAFVLAAAGLLDGRRAVTHWAAGERLAREFPRVRVETDPIFVRDGGVYTSAGVTAGMDLALALVEEDHGPALARAVARRLVLFLRRPGGQNQFSVALGREEARAGDTPAGVAGSRGSRALADLPAWMVAHLDRDLAVPALARRVGLSPRHFTRCFAQRFGTTPARYVEALRVESARRQLETAPGSRRGLKAIAAACGFASTAVLGRAFRRRLGISVAAYRARFIGPAA